MYGSTLRSKCAGIHNPYRRCAFDKCTVFSIEATRNLLDCRVKPDNDKNGVNFKQPFSDNPNVETTLDTDFRRDGGCSSLLHSYLV
jgi:hypothetical protein